MVVAQYLTPPASHVRVFAGSGNGSFAAPRQYPIGGGGAATLALADLDGMPPLDVVAGNYDGSSLSVLLGRCIP